MPRLAAQINEEEIRSPLPDHLRVMLFFLKLMQLELMTMNILPLFG